MASRRRTARRSRPRRAAARRNEARTRPPERGSAVDPVANAGGKARGSRRPARRRRPERCPHDRDRDTIDVAIRIGCSGFLYDHWRPGFYPRGTRGTELETYARSFDTVELNVTFYRMPSSATFRSWARRVPDDFVFAVKASRYISHIRRLRDVGDSVRFLVERAAELGPHLGPILIQLPPDMEVEVELLASTLDAFPPGIRLAVEPRHESWFEDDVRSVLAEHNATLCLADRRGP